MLQESQKVHNEAIAKKYTQLRNLLSGDLQSQFDRVCREMHKRDARAGVNGQVTKREASTHMDVLLRLS